MAEHAFLSASSAHRWINCTPSARTEEGFEDVTSEAALEGTAAHALCEYKLKTYLGEKEKRPVSDYDSDLMEEYTDDYLNFVIETLEEAKRTCKDPIVLVEQRLDFSNYVTDGFGTGDCIIVADKKLHIIDMKYGQGVLVSAEYNPQMMLYALGALNIYDSLYDIEEVSMTIFQPRRENVSTFTLSVKELVEWGEDKVKPKAEAAFAGEGTFTPGEWCTFCKAKHTCRARAELMLKTAGEEFKRPPLLSDEEIEEILVVLPELTKWANEINAYATDAAINHGKVWKGFKLVEGRSIRKFSDPEEVEKVALANGYEDIYRKDLITLTDMQKLMGKTKFEDLLGGLIHKPPGKPTLVPETDKRPAIKYAINEFNEIKEEN